MKGKVNGGQLCAERGDHFRWDFPTIPYDEAKDAARYADCPGADLVIGEGYFLVVFPEDAHEPGLAVGGVCAPVKKVVMKVPVE